MALAIKYVFTIPSQYLQKWLSCDIKYVKNRHFSPEMTLTCIMVTKRRKWYLHYVSDTIHADSLALFALNVEIVLADVTKPEKSNILTLTWPVTSSVTYRSTFTPGLEG